MVTKILPLSLGKRLSCGIALSGILLSAGIFGLATAETTETEISKPVRILLTDDTPDTTLSVRRKPADQRNLDKLYNNELRPTKMEPKKVVEAEEKSAPQAEIVTPAAVGQSKEKSQTKSTKNGLESVLNILTFPEFDLFGDIESVFTGIGNDLSSATTAVASENSSRYDSKMKHPGTFTPRHVKKATAAPVHMPTIGSLGGIEFPKITLADLNSIFGTSTAPLVDEDDKIPTVAPETLPEKSNEPAKDAVEDQQTTMPVKERHGIIAFLGLEDLAIPEFDNPFAVGTGIKETEQDVEPVETKIVNSDLGVSDVEPDETITSELPSLNTERPTVPGVNQIPTLAPKKIPNAPTPLDEQDKSASRMSPYKTLVNPDHFLPQRSAIPVSVRISDSVDR